MAELHADGRATNEELHAVQPPFIRGGNVADNGVHYAAAPNRLFRSWVNSALSFAAWAVQERGPQHDAERLAQCHVIRDIFGSLRFRPVELDPAMLHDPIIPKLAATIYEENAYDRLPIMADELEKAGCQDADILDHCRQTVNHVRGCWVVDLILGKQ